MQAIYHGGGGGNWYGVQIDKGVPFDVPPHLEWRVKAGSPLFEIVDADSVEVIEKPRRGRPRKNHADAD